MTQVSTDLTPRLAHLPHFSDDSRVWVYIAREPISADKVSLVADRLKAFTNQWTAHNQALKAASEIYDNQIIILMVDETAADASGCSIDKSVHFLEQLGQETGNDFFERMRFFRVAPEGTLLAAGRPGFQVWVENGDVTPETIVLNTLVQTKAQLRDQWLMPFGKSWLKRLF